PAGGAEPVDGLLPDHSRDSRAPDRAHPQLPHRPALVPRVVRLPLRRPDAEGHARPRRVLHALRPADGGLRPPADGPLSAAELAVRGGYVSAFGRRPARTFGIGLRPTPFGLKRLRGGRGSPRARGSGPPP